MGEPPKRGVPSYPFPNVTVETVILIGDTVNVPVISSKLYPSLTSLPKESMMKTLIVLLIVPGFVI